MPNTKTILLVEDDIEDQAFFIEALAQVAPESLFEVANNGIDALYKLKNTRIRPDIIFMDVNMPHMDGIDCLKEIMRDDKIKDIPVIMLTSSVKDVELTRELGAKAFIEKPNDSKTLSERLKEFVKLGFIFDNKTIQDV
jgi:CheY-like chemotaxis protein